MKITIDIPKEFEEHFNEDKFKDNLERVKCYCTEMDYTALSCQYDLDVLAMLIEAFKNAEPVKYGHWICHRKNYYDANGDIYMSRPMPTECSVCGFAEIRAKRFALCPNCGARMED